MDDMEHKEQLKQKAIEFAIAASSMKNEFLAGVEKEYGKGGAEMVDYLTQAKALTSAVMAIAVMAGMEDDAVKAQAELLSRVAADFSGRLAEAYDMLGPGKPEAKVFMDLSERLRDNLEVLKTGIFGELAKHMDVTVH